MNPSQRPGLPIVLVLQLQCKKWCKTNGLFFQQSRAEGERALGNDFPYSRTEGMEWNSRAPVVVVRPLRRASCSRAGVRDNECALPRAAALHRRWCERESHGTDAGTC